MKRERERENRPGEGGLPSVGLGGVAMIISSEFYRTEMNKGKNKIEKEMVELLHIKRGESA